MGTDLILELFGYAASLVIAISLMMTSVLRLRVLNLVGSIAFVVYAVLIEAWPVVGLNVFIAAVNVFFLTKLLRRRTTFGLMEAAPNSAYLERFLDFYAEDIRRSVPDFERAHTAEGVRVFVLRDLVPAGLMVGTQRGSDLHVDLDYATPDYRDLKIGRYLYGPAAGFFEQRGVERFISHGGAAEHSRYLKRIGYTPEGDYWVLPLT